MTLSKNTRPTLLITEDQSHTLYIKEMDETYHSKHGAINESQHVYIQSGLSHKTSCQDAVNVLEIGFGTGLNALLTFIEAEQLQKKIYYQTFEPYPIPNHLVDVLNYGTTCNTSTAKELLQQLHQAEWNRKITLSDYFTIEKIADKFGNTPLQNNYFDVVYFDAFAPSKQPEVWSERNLKLCFDALKKGGIFTTYSVQGVIKRKLISIGFEVKKIPGPKGKREILHAIKK